VLKSRNRLGKVIDEFAKLAGIGRKSAERLPTTYCGSTRPRRWLLADAIRNVRRISLLQNLLQPFRRRAVPDMPGLAAGPDAAMRRGASRGT